MVNKIAIALIVFAPVLAAQQVVAPTPETVGPARGTNIGNYNVVDSVETGYRLALIDGNLGKYRSDVNYRNGIRLLGSKVTVNSRDGHGRLFDEIVLTTLGLGNDPYQSAILRIQKNGLYRYDMVWRLDEYYNPALTISAGEHLLDTRRRMQDHDLVLLPQSRLKFHLGYSRNSQSGPALTTVQLFDARGDEFPLFADVRRQNNEYRIGSELDFFGMHLMVQHRWDDYKEDTPVSLGGSTGGNNPLDNTTLTQFRRTEPIHGTSPAWLGNLHGEHQYWAVNARMTYVGATRNFILDEASTGISRVGLADARQVLVSGDATRPSAAGDLSISFFPGERLTVVNNTSAYSTRTNGNAAFTQFDNLSLSANTIYFRYLGIRTVANATDVTFRANKWLGFYTGYHFSTRRVRTVEGRSIASIGGQTNLYEQENNLHAGLAGIRITPVKPLAINLDGEVGRADGPFTPVSERAYHALRGRVQYRRRSVLLETSYRQNYNNNSVSLSTHSLRSRQYSASGTWTPRGWFALDAGYMKLHLDTVSGLAFFAGTPPALFQGLDSVYVSNIHAANLGAHFGIRNRVDLYAGYSITKDTGDGRASALPFATTDPAALALVPVQTYPLTFQSPLGRVSLRITNKIRWNAGWQFYRYHEEFGLFSVLRNYRAHTGYTSVQWAF